MLSYAIKYKVFQLETNLEITKLASFTNNEMETLRLS